MSNTDKSVAAPKPGVVTTRWWWVRHAPVREDNGCIYGQKDLGCDTSDRVVFDAVGKILPRNAAWYASTLKRTHQTADAIFAAGFPKPASMPHIKEFAEQHLGEWQGMNRAAFLASRPAGSHWFAAIDEAAPGGESFMDLYNRTCGAHRSHQCRAGGQGRHRRRPWRHDQGRGRSRARRPAGQGTRVRHRQLLGDAARSCRERRSHRLAAADGQPAALDRRRLAQRHASAGGTGDCADQACVALRLSKAAKAA